MTETILVVLLLGGSVMIAYLLRRVAQLQEDARINPIPPIVEDMAKEVTTNTYQVSFQLRRLKTVYSDPLTALVNALHGRKEA